MNEERLASIIARIADNTATDEDLALYNAWCNQMQQTGRVVNDHHLALTEARTLEQIRKRTGQAGNRGVIRRLAAAAALTGVLVGGIYAYHHMNGTRQTPATSQISNNDIASGKNMATLTLANGKKIILADSKAGKLAEEKGAEVAKTANGSLEYRPVASNGNEAPQFNVLNTGRGEQYQITLSDGTRVWLNAATSLRFPATFSKNGSRVVEVTGEAYFEVTQDPSHPFIIHTPKQEIKVLGTSFNVNNYQDEPFAKTTLLTGAVSINDKLLKPGQQAISDNKGMLRIAAVSPEAIVAWKNGYFEFNDENIYDIMRKIARWYDVEVVYEGTIPVNGMEGTISRFENVSKVLGTIEKAGLLKFRIDKRKIYVSKY
ncbi:FecR domain-containing protein [Chitinophaga sp. 212800010-3]|uniref:FecR family protein n=1 Tax=unclassified Chitinophaga TaxID=2619133 RepID=UPI002DE35837|nr:FecR family protein [Chitinophaga sp. 212800010-3]